MTQPADQHGPRALWLTVDAEVLDDPAIVRARVAAADGPGWLQTTATVWVRREAGAPLVALLPPARAHAAEAQLADETPLDGDWSLGHERAAQLRHLGTTWVWTSLSWSDHQAPGAIAVRAVEHRHIANDRGSSAGVGIPKGTDRMLRSVAFWRQVAEGDPAIGVWRPWLAAFCGFEVGAAPAPDKE